MPGNEVDDANKRERRKIAENLGKARQEDALNRQREIVEKSKEQVANDRVLYYARLQDTQRKESKSSDSNGTWLQELIGSSKKLKTESVTSIHDYRACMMALAGLCLLAVKALWHARANFIQKAIDGAIDLASAGTESAGNSALFRSFADKFKDEEDIKLPPLTYDVQCADDGTVTVGPIRLEETGEEISQQVSSLFRRGVVLWLKERGYDEVPGQPGKFVNEEGAFLTKAAFDALANDGENGLASSLVDGLSGGADFRPASPSPR